MVDPSSDRISNLPDCLLEDILVRVPVQEVVKTSILSKRWIKMWTQLPKLVFDSSFCEKPVRKNKKELIKKIISSTRKPLLSFALSLPTLSRSDLNQLVNDESLHGIEHFKLETPWIQYPLDTSFFLRAQPKSLKLGSCLCELPDGFNGFPMLTYLNFSNVCIDGGEFSDLVSSCPLLEILVIKDPDVVFYLDLVSPNLKVFVCEGDILDLCFKYTPQLKKVKVYLDDNCLDEEDIVKVSLEMPFGVISSVTDMLLNGCFLKYMNQGKESEMSRNDLNNLKRLSLKGVSFEDKEQALNVLCLIRHSSNLEIFMIEACEDIFNYGPALETLKACEDNLFNDQFGIGTALEASANDQSAFLTALEALKNDHPLLYQSAFEPDLEVWENDPLSDASLNNLRVVGVDNLTGKCSELLFIKTILAKCHMLEKMQITAHHSITEEKYLRILKEVRQFRRASSQVEITGTPILDSRTRGD